jgi:hypothetical protein
MKLTTHKKFKGDRLMPWGKATVVTDAKGYVFLSGNTATADDYDPVHQRTGAAGDAAMHGARYLRTSNQTWRKSAVPSNTWSR